MRLTTLCWTLIFVVCLFDVLFYLLQKVYDDPAAKVQTLFMGDNIKHDLNTTFCKTMTPCEYPEEVDLRLIVLTYNRSESLKQLLTSLNSLIMDGDSVSLEIWIDRGKDGRIDDATLSVAESFPWKLGPRRVHTQSRHVGICGQWIYTWLPHADTKEIALLLEDDLSVSPYAYRWLKAARRYYGARSDVMGYTLQSDNVNLATGKGPLQESKQKVTFMYRLLGSWGFAPQPEVWRNFQRWYGAMRSLDTFKPYVDDIIMTKWYKSFEKKGTADSMWTMWFIYFTNNQNLYCVYNNLNVYLGSEKKCLAVNRREPGLHYSGKPTDNVHNLLQTWDPAFTLFSKDTTMYLFDGTKLKV